MNDRPAEALLPLSVKVVFSGQDAEDANLYTLKSGSAILSFPDKRPLWVGRLLALCVGDLPAIPARIRNIEGGVVDIAFANELHPSVLEHAREMLMQASEQTTSN